jgi:ceramide glucosyltransferase
MMTLVLAIYALAAGVTMRWFRGRSNKMARRTTSGESPGAKGGKDAWPTVTVLKPLRGVDDALEANLESFLRLSYPAVDFIFATRSPDDPALDVVRRIVARHPRAKVRILDDCEGSASNPKVLLLEAMLPYARGEFLLISDSNVRAERDDLQSLVEPMADEGVGLVFQPVIGIGEESAAAAMENLRLSEQATMGMVFVKNIVGVDAVMGKGILLRRKALVSIGQFSRLRDVLAEDYLIGVEMKREGWDCVLSRTPARAVHVNWSLKCVVSRHVRHCSMRFRLSPFTYPIEMLTSPTIVGMVLPIVAGWAGLAVSATAVSLKTLLDAMVMRSARGTWPRLRDVPLIPLKDLLMAGVWFSGLWVTRLNWRGVSYRIGMGTRLVLLDAPILAETPDVVRMPVPGERRRAA